MKIFKPIWYFFTLLLFILTFLACTKFASKTDLFEGNTIQKIVQEQGRSVVYIVMYDEKAKPLSIGSGFFVSQNGMIATNYHVVEKGYSIIITTLDGKAYKNVYLLSQDKDMDIALLKVDETKSPQARLGNSETVKQADKVISIGNPQGLQNSVSDGIISAVRKFEGVMIFQFTCPISQGSSGGPLYNMAGEVIGITTLISKSGQNLNFAIPINYLLSVQKNEQAISITERIINERNKLLAEYRERQKLSSSFDSQDALFEEAHNLFEEAGKLLTLPESTTSKANRDKEIELLEKAIRINPYYHAAYVLLGSIYADGENVEKAEYYMKYSIELKPNYSDAYLNLAKFYKKYKWHVENIDFYLKRAIELTPKSPEAYLELANSYTDSGMYDEAIKFYRIGLNIDTNIEFLSDELRITSICSFAELLLKRNPNEVENIYTEIEELCRNIVVSKDLNILLSTIFLKNGFSKLSYQFLKKSWGWDLSVDDIQERLKLYKPYLDNYDIYAWLSVGRMYFMTNEYEKAIDYLQKAWSIDKDQFDLYYELGDSLYEKDKYTEASNFLEAGLKKDPNNYDIILTLGNVYNFDKSLEFYYKIKPDYLRAIELYKKATLISPTAYGPYNNLSLAYYNNEQAYDALREIKNTLNLIPTHNKYFNKARKNALILQGDIFQKVDNNEAAIKSYKEAIEFLDIKKDLYDYKRIAEKMYRLKEYDKAINLLKVVLDEAKKTNNQYYNYETYSLLGDIYKEKSDVNTALGYYMEANVINPKNYSNNFYIANCYHSLKKWDEAAKWWKKAIEIYPKDSASFYNLGLAYFNTNRIDLALVNFKSAQEFDPSDDSVKQHIKKCESIIERKNYPDKLKKLSLRKDSVGTSARLLSLIHEYNIANDLFIEGRKETKPIMSGEYITSYSVSSKIYESMGRFEDIGKKLDALKNEHTEYDNIIKYFRLAISNRVSGIEQNSQGYYISKKDYRGEFEKGSAKITLGDKNLVDCMEDLLRLISKQKADFGDSAIENLESAISYYKN